MARARRPGFALLEERRIGYLSKLILRDPLTHDFLRFPHFDKLYSPDRAAQQTYWKHQDQLYAKWGVTVRPIPPPFEQVPESLRDDTLKALSDRRPWNSEDLELYCDLLFSKGVRATRVVVSGQIHPIRYTFNDGCVAPELIEKWATLHEGRQWPKGYWDSGMAACRELAQGRRTEGWDGYHGRPCFGVYGRPLDQAHTVNIKVDLAELTTRNLKDLAVEVAKLLRAALQLAPNAPRGRDPHALAFLRTITPRAFDRALKAYDLHVSEGLTLAETARRLKMSPTRVEEGVKQIYLAIHRTRYTARRRRLDTPAQGMPEYHCPQHGRDCPDSCPYMMDWWQRVNRTLPTDTTGSGRHPR